MIINFQRRYTQEQWERLVIYAKDHGYPNLTEMITRIATRVTYKPGLCAPCEGFRALKFDKNLELQFPDDNGSKIVCAANNNGISPSEHIARIVTDPILGLG